MTHRLGKAIDSDGRDRPARRILVGADRRGWPISAPRPVQLLDATLTPYVDLIAGTSRRDVDLALEGLKNTAPALRGY